MRKSAFAWLGRLHIWIGWLVAVPLLLWTVSGLFMVSQPIETVRGENLKTHTAASPLRYADIRLFADPGKPVRNARLAATAARDVVDRRICRWYAATLRSAYRTRNDGSR